MAYVDVDNTAGEREATQVLIDRGCRRSDFTEAGGQRAAEELMAALPDLDGLVVAERTTPRLTTVRQPAEEMAERATRLLLEQLDGRTGGSAMRVIIPPQLVRRDSA